MVDNDVNLYMWLEVIGKILHKQVSARIPHGKKEDTKKTQRRHKEEDDLESS
jgi:hypothetical protein